jgi:hypothetical protein
MPRHSRVHAEGLLYCDGFVISANPGLFYVHETPPVVGVRANLWEVLNE